MKLALVCQVLVEVDLHLVRMDGRATKEECQFESDHVGEDEGDAGLHCCEVPLRERSRAETTVEKEYGNLGQAGAEDV